MTTPTAKSDQKPSNVIPIASAAGDIPLRTDYTRSEQLVDHLKGSLRHVPAWNKWYGYDEALGLWQPTKAKDPDKSEAGKYGAVLIERGLMNPNPDERTVQFELAKNLHSMRTLNAMLPYAKNHGDITLDPVELDSHNHLLHCTNGTLNLRTLRLQPHSPEDFITLSTGTKYDTKAKSDLWTNFLKDSVPDKKVRSFLRRMFGYALLGEPDAEKFLLIIGPPGTGKSTFLESITEAVGAHHYRTQPYTFLQPPRGGGDGPRSDRVKLKGKRLVTLNEVPENACFDADFVNGFVSRNRYTTRGVYHSDETEVVPMGVLIMSGNHRPQAGNSAAIFRRVLEVSFEHEVADKKQDEKLRAQLFQPKHRAAILAWGVEGLRQYKQENGRGGLRPPEVVLAATRDYEADQNPLREWLAKCTEEKPGKEAYADLYESYMRYTDAHEKRKGLSKKMFGHKLSKFKRSNSKGVRYVKGLVLNAAQRELLNAGKNLGSLGQSSKIQRPK